MGNGDVRFARIRGRIVPIKRKKNNDLAIGVAAGTGFALGKINFPKLDKQKIVKFNKFNQTLKYLGTKKVYRFDKAAPKKLLIGAAVGGSIGYVIGKIRNK